MMSTRSPVTSDDATGHDGHPASWPLTCGPSARHFVDISQRDGHQHPAPLSGQRPRRRDQHHRRDRGDGGGVASLRQGLLRLAVGSPAAARLAVAGYGFSKLDQALLLFRQHVAAPARWADRAGKGIRTAARRLGGRLDRREPSSTWPSVFTARPTPRRYAGPADRWASARQQRGKLALGEDVFRTIVLVAHAPAAGGGVACSWRDARPGQRAAVRIPRLAMSMIFMLIVALFDLGTLSDGVPGAAQEEAQRGGILGMLDHLQPDLHGNLHARRRAVRPHRAAESSIIGGSPTSSTPASASRRPLRHLGSLRPVRALLRHGVRHGQGAGGGPGARDARHGLRDVANATLGILDFPASAIAGVLCRASAAGRPGPPRLHLGGSPLAPRRCCWPCTRIAAPACADALADTFACSEEPAGPCRRPSSRSCSATASCRMGHANQGATALAVQVQVPDLGSCRAHSSRSRRME